MPLASRVRSLNCETNWPRLMPNLPSEVPTGGAGVAWPPGTWNFACADELFCHVCHAWTVVVEAASR